MDVLYGLAKDFVFREAVAFLKGKRALTSEEYRLLDDESRAKAFTVSGYTSLGVLQEFLDCLTKAAEEGTTKEQFREDIPLYMVKHQVRPGITGWAQVNDLRGDTSIEDRIAHDIYYIENWSLLFDLKILLITVFGGKFLNSEKLS